MSPEPVAPNRRVTTSWSRWERPEDTIRTDAHRSSWTTFVLFFARPLWRFRVELLLVTFVSHVAWWFAAASLYLSGSTVPGLALFSVICIELLCWPSSRRRLLDLLHARSVRRRFESACRYALLVTTNDRTLHIRKLRRTPAGEILDVIVPPSMSTVPLVDAAETIASGMGVKEVRVDRDKEKADRATVSIIRRDPLASPQPLPWPNLPAPQLSVWNPIPVGVDEMGEVVTLSLPERMVLFGAETGGGKSVAMSQLVATAALDPKCELTLLDGKQVELAFWRDCAARIAGPSVPQAISVLEALRSEMDSRYELLLDAGRRKIEPGDGIPLSVVVCDELAFYLNMGERKESQEFSRLFRDLVARGRAAGIVVLAATQKPSHEIIPTSIRDLFAVRWALRCTTPQASDTILGQGWSSEGFNAKDIDIACRGVGYLLHEGGSPIRLRSFFLSDDDLRMLAARGAQLRQSSRSEVGEEVVPIRKNSAA
jgi:hypothetical protein